MERLLEPDEPDPVMVQNPNGASKILLISDHAGRRIPRLLGTLGLGDADLERHIAWDIGIRDVTTQIADKLGAIGRLPGVLAATLVYHEVSTAEALGEPACS